MRTSIYLAVAFAILFISLSDAAVYKRQPGNGTPNGSNLAKSISNGVKTRSNMLQRRRVDRDQIGVSNRANDAGKTADGATGDVSNDDAGEALKNAGNTVKDNGTTVRDASDLVEGIAGGNRGGFL